MTYPVTVKLGALIASAANHPLPPSVATRAKVALIDTIGTMLAGYAEPAAALLRTVVCGGSGIASNVCDQAMVDAAAAHALDFDDVAYGGHPSAVIVPTLLATARVTGARGEEVLRAYAVGYEAWAELATRERTLYHARGLHPTGILGPIAAAAAGAALLRLDAAAAARALAIAASQSAGLVANFGTMTKSFHAGAAARAGVMAVQLARHGYSASLEALEADNGMLASFSPKGQVDLERPLNFDSSGWRLAHVAPNIKRYPVCYAAHRSIDAALQLRQTFLPKPDEIASIVATISPRHSETLRHRRPTTVAEARFSLEFCVATALAQGWVGLGELVGDTLNDPRILGLMARTSRNLATDPDSVLDGFALFDQVLVTRTDGTVLMSDHVRRARGHADNPIEIDEIRQKFEDCIRAGKREMDASALFRSLSRLEDADDCRAIFDFAPMPQEVDLPPDGGRARSTR